MQLIQETGTYLVTVKSAEFAESKVKGTPSLHVIFETLDGLEIGHDFWLSENAAPKTALNLKQVFGFKGDYHTAPALLRGQRALITVEDEIYKGIATLKCKWVNHPDQEKAAQSPEATLSFLDKITKQATELLRPEREVGQDAPDWPTA